MAKQSEPEFDPILVDVIGKALFMYDNAGRPATSWEESASRREYCKFAEVALTALLAHGKPDHHFVLTGYVPIDGHPNYHFSSTPLATLEEAEKVRDEEIERYAESNITVTIDHSARVHLNTYRYWTQPELDEISAIAKERAAELARYAE